MQWCVEMSAERYNQGDMLSFTSIMFRHTYDNCGSGVAVQPHTTFTHGTTSSRSCGNHITGVLSYTHVAWQNDQVSLFLRTMLPLGEELRALIMKPRLLAVPVSHTSMIHAPDQGMLRRSDWSTADFQGKTTK